MKPKLLIIEDDENLRTQMKWALAQDYEVFLAGDRLSALEVLKKERPTVAILDNLLNNLKTSPSFQSYLLIDGRPPFSLFNSMSAFIKEFIFIGLSFS